MKKNGRYVMYLRKSRKDGDLSDDEVLARHERMLYAAAKQNGIAVSDAYKEVKSGDSISGRPMMQRLLEEVSEGIWDGVLVVEIERLARGNSIDQGLVLQAFQQSDTLIITPNKVYDPNDEMDEEFFEFGLFMSRREYKMIKKRLIRGSVAASSEGKFAGKSPAFGYDKEKAKDGKGFVLVPNPEESEIVRNIFDWYLNGLPTESGRKEIGATGIANYLNKIGLKTKSGSNWSCCTVNRMLKNPVYIGKICWSRNGKLDYIDEDGNAHAVYDHDIKWIKIYNGLHERIIDEDVYYAVQKKRKDPKWNTSRINDKLSNQFVGIIKCGMCGKTMSFRRDPNHGNRVRCRTYGCKCVSCFANDLEEAIIEGIRAFADRSINAPEGKDDVDLTYAERMLDTAQKELTALYQQFDKICSAYEKGIYSDEVFVSRSESIQNDIKNKKDDVEKLNRNLLKLKNMKSSKESIIPEMVRITEMYWDTDDMEARNNMLKQCLDHVTYLKTNRSAKQPKDFSIVIHPKI